MEGQGEAGESAVDVKEQLTLRPDPEKMAESMRRAYMMAFAASGEGKQRKIPAWMLAVKEESKKETKHAEDVNDQDADDVDDVDDCDETTAAQQGGRINSNTDLCNFCGAEVGENYGDDFAFETELLCLECAQSERVDIDGTVGAPYV